MRHTVYANHEAADLCKRAITNADRLEPPLRNPLVLDAAMLQAELHLNVSDFENAVADFGLAEKAASDAGLVEVPGRCDLWRRSRALQSEADH